MPGKLARYLGYGLIVSLLVRRGPREVPAARGPHEKENETKGTPAPAAAAQKSTAAASKGPLDYFKRTFQFFSDDDCMTQAAAIAYYTVFSLPSLLLIVIAVAGMVFGRAAVQHHIQEQIQGMMGGGAAGQVETMVRSAGQSHSASIVGAVVGILALIFGATGAMTALQDALNRTWHVKPNPQAGGVKSFLGKRILSFAMILAIGFLLLVSLAISAALSAIGGWIAAMMPGFISGPLLHAIGEVISLAVIAVLFGAIFRFLPDAQVGWRDVWVGAVITSILFTAGKAAIGFYLGHSGAASAYGAAGSLMLIVLWLYYGSLILLLGAEFTRVWATAHARPIRPQPGAVEVVTEERRVG